MTNHAYRMAVVSRPEGGWVTVYCVECGFRMEVDPDQKDYGTGQPNELFALTQADHAAEY